jgi:hypothetical protein
MQTVPRFITLTCCSMATSRSRVPHAAEASAGVAVTHDKKACNRDEIEMILTNLEIRPGSWLLQQLALRWLSLQLVLHRFLLQFLRC